MERSAGCADRDYPNRDNPKGRGGGVGKGKVRPVRGQLELEVGWGERNISRPGVSSRASRRRLGRTTLDLGFSTFPLAFPIEVRPRDSDHPPCRGDDESPSAPPPLPPPAAEGSHRRIVQSSEQDANICAFLGFHATEFTLPLPCPVRTSRRIARSLCHTYTLPSS
jgi:hypothetical protein